jgi:hypothetical protein
MLSSLSLGSIDNLEKLPINSLNSICDRVRQALLHVFLPRLCQKCQPAFSEVFKKTQSTPVLLKALCDTCKINYIKDKRSVSRKKSRTLMNNSTFNQSIIDDQTDIPEGSSEKASSLSTSTKHPAKKKRLETSRTSESSCVNSSLSSSSSSSFSNHNIGNLTVKIKLIRTLGPDGSFSASPPEPFKMPLTPPPTEFEDSSCCGKTVSDEKDDCNLTVLIDNSSLHSENSSKTLGNNVQIYEYLSGKGVDWCRYCGVAGDTGTFWKLGPWGDRTLCHKHGCEFFGCGFARVTKTRLDLTKFYREKRLDRVRPIVSEFCSICWNQNDTEKVSESLINCNGCPLAFHQACLTASSKNSVPFYCSEGCSSNFEKCLIRPQFHSKTSFPYYRKILTLDKGNDAELQPGQQIVDLHDKNIKQRVGLGIGAKLISSHTPPPPQQQFAPVLKKRKYNHRKFNEHQVDRIVPFVPIKVDQAVHLHENINTPQWTLKPLHERQNYASEVDSAAYAFEDLDEENLLKRHARYENVEKTTRLLKPGVFRQLIYDARQ